MIATSDNTFRRCDCCGRVQSFVLGSAFQRDGTATFRLLCAPCERAEKPINQPALFLGAPVHAWTEPEPEVIEETAPVSLAQMSLF
jgi:hypothetical protein